MVIFFCNDHYLHFMNFYDIKRNNVNIIIIMTCVLVKKKILIIIVSIIIVIAY